MIYLYLVTYHIINEEVYMKETDLYPPIKHLFESLGYNVHGEVNDIDVIAKNDTAIIAIELKTVFSISLISQGAKRQCLTDLVYIAIPKPSKKIIKSKIFRDKHYILKRLGIGLVFVDLISNEHIATIYLEPFLQDIKRAQSSSRKRRLALYNEVKARHTNIDTGGTRGKIMTAYRESSLHILYLLQDGAIHTTKELGESTKNSKTTNILYRNHYNWFIYVKRASYTISDIGRQALVDYASILKNLLNNNFSNK